jgi:hypothetical protein
VAGRLGRSFTGGQIGELVRLDIVSWSHMQTATVEVVRDMVAAGRRLGMRAIRFTGAQPLRSALAESS